MLAAVTALGLTGCGGSSGDEDVIKVGLVQLVEHTSLDQIRESIIDRLEEEGYVDGENISIDYQNAQNEQSNLQTICQGFVADDVDVIIAITTPATQAAMNVTDEIPIVFSAVTDPIASEVVSDLENPGGNVTGTSDIVSAEQIMGLAEEITPGYETIGALYNSSETNSVAVVEDLKEYAAANGLEVEEAAVTNASEIQQAAQSLAQKCDIVFSPTDNTVASSIATANQVFIEAGVPFYVGADSMVKDGALATYGINYQVLGQETADMVIEIINGADPAEMPVRTMEDMEVYINSQTAADMGIDIPQAVLDRATDLAKEDL
ncbi:MAG TPA: ABC transporter substrate-binding protein [Candidatus Copromorpha excrementigallinarum]|uniref:ABC transporter substrate-binding protein n=1 Tax=Candidatus Allocopromorpha excrementigallinarum TaxID=2840742 RepID=A0A9D1HYL2_9FIRM|nr:ABC transporter substrate-binding protein [Candidatus Copromorpha excrementigallinarum]